jgi:hypothetical protein
MTGLMRYASLIIVLAVLAFATSCTKNGQIASADVQSFKQTAQQKDELYLPPNTPKSIRIWQTLGALKLSGDKPSDNVAVVLDKPIVISGFVLVNEASPEGATDFLLTPSSGGCIHVPPPPPNYLIHVVMENGKPAEIPGGPVTVFGKLSIVARASSREYYSYELSARKVESFFDSKEGKAL